MTVKVHRGPVMRKMRARSLPEFGRIAEPLARPANVGTLADGSSRGPLKLLHLRRCRTGTEVGIQGLREAGVLLRVPMFIL
jgi:hypothetical protein